MRLSVPNQKLPVSFMIRMQLTSAALTFDPPSLDFGACVLGERAGLCLRVTNGSRLPQVRMHV
jgi:hypothetical protein